MPRFSLITCTIGRVDELEALYTSIAAQGRGDIECILVDQNPDDRLLPVLERWRREFSIVHLRSAPGLSRARNVGLGHVTGELFAFPDDDCWYSPGLLDNVSRWFDEHPDYGVLTVGAQDGTGSPSGNRWVEDACDIKPINSFRTTFSSTIFVRRTELSASVRFDEALGVGAGTPFSSGEETEYILKILQKGTKGYFDRKWWIGHPIRNMLSGTVNADRARSYGRGMGYVLRKRSLFPLWVSFLAYDFLRAALVLVKGDIGAARLCVYHGQGVFSGYLAAPVDGKPER